MKNFCEKHHLSYVGARCPMCEKERIASFRVSEASRVVPCLASRESYYDEYMKPESITISDSDMEAMLLDKFGKVSKL